VTRPDIEQVRQLVAESVTQVVRESGPRPGDALIDKLYGDRPLTAQERHDLATVLYATQRACGPIDSAAAVRKAIRLDGLMQTWRDVFGEAS
jgi:hypothetical protein